MRLGWFDMLPDRAFVRQPGLNRPATLEGGKGGAPAPDPNIGVAQQQMADLAKEQWTEFKTNIYPTLIAAQQRQEARLDKQYAKILKSQTSILNKHVKLLSATKKALSPQWRSSVQTQKDTMKMLTESS